MNSTSTEAVIIQAVLAGSSFGAAAAGAWASASGACTRMRSSRPVLCSIFIRASPFCVVLVRAPHRKEAYLSLTGVEILGMKPERAARAVGEPALEGEPDGAEGDVLPRDLVFIPERHFQRLLARLELERAQARPVKQVHLVHRRHRDHAERRAELDLGAGFLERLAQRALRGGFAVLHEARRQRPVA